MNSPRRTVETKSRNARRTGATIVGLILAVAISTRAQEAATPSYLPPANEVMQLDKLQVNGHSDEQSYSIQRSVTATKTDTALVNVPQAVSVVTRELIDDQSMRNIGDLTRYVPGVGTAQGEGNRDTAVFRGNSTTADFFIDGVRDDVQYYRDLYNVDRVEVLKGPNAMIFGRGGAGGLLNRVTKQPAATSFSEATFQVGSWDQYRGTIDVNQAVDHDFALRVTGMYEDSGSYRDDVSLRRYGINPTVAWKIAARTKLRLGYEYFDDERTADRGVPSFAGAPLKTAPSTFFGDPAQSPVTASVHILSAVLDHQFSNGMTLRNHSRFSTYAKTYQNVFPGAVDATATNVALSAYNNATDRDNVFNQTDVVHQLDTWSVHHVLLAGLELSRQETDNLRNTGYFTTVGPNVTSILVPINNPRTTFPLTFRPGATDADNHGVAKSAALYVQDQATLLPNLQAIAGVRVERFSVDFDNHRTATELTSEDTLVSPRVGLIYKPAAEISVYSSYSMSYVPRAGEQLSSLSLTNQALDPEEFKGYEVGVKWDVRPDLAVTAAAYRLDRTNVVITDPADSTKSILVDGQEAKGVEFGFTGRLNQRWSVAGGYAYQDGKIKTTQSATVIAGARLAQLPRHTFSWWNRYDFNPQWGVGLGTIYRDAIYASTDNTVALPSFVRFDAAAFFRFSKNVRAQLNVENLLNRNYYASANSNNNITPGSPRAVRFSVTTRF